jgi:ligand-binding sensor domain-containing protein
MTRAARLLPLAAAALAGCTTPRAARPGVSPELSGVGPASEDQVLVPAFDVIPAVAVSQHTVYVATTDGIGALDRDFRRWLPPVTRARGYPGGVVTAIAADPVEEGVWVALAGALVYYRPALTQLVATPIPGPVDAIIFDQRDLAAGAYVHSAGGWALASHTGFAMPVDPSRVPPPGARLVPSTLGDVYRAYPALQSAGRLITRDAELRSWPIIAGARSPDQSEVWLGTRGGGLYRADPIALTGEQYPFGPLETGTGALARAADGIWMAGLGQSPVGRGGLAFASTDLQRWRWIEGPLSRPLAGARARRLAVRGSEAWLATDHGLAWLDTRSGDRVRLWNLGNGLPSDQALSVAATTGGTWVGTTRGLVFVADSDSGPTASRNAVSTPLLTGSAIGALLLSGDTLWIGSDAGLLLLRATASDSTPRRVAVADARLTRPIRALARSDSLVAVATAADLVVLDLARGASDHRFDAVNPSLLRGITAVAMDEHTIWLAGLGGVLVIQRATRASHFLAVPAAVPAEAYDVVLDPAYAWIATRAGVLRLRRLSDGGVR